MKTPFYLSSEWDEEKHLNRRCMNCGKDTSNSIKAGLCGDCDNPETSPWAFEKKALK